MEQWFQLAAAVLAHQVSNFAVVTSPRSNETRLRHVQLVPLHELSALCVVVLNEARIRQQVLSLREPVDENDAARGGGPDQRALRRPDAAAVSTAAGAGVGAREPGRPGSHGAHGPGVAWRSATCSVTACARCYRSPSSRARSACSTSSTFWSSARSPTRSRFASSATTASASSSAARTATNRCGSAASWSRVTEAGGPSGVVAVLGPTRMRYSRTIPTVRYLAAVLGELMQQI